jgi:hypothetical protein
LVTFRKRFRSHWLCPSARYGEKVGVASKFVSPECFFFEMLIASKSFGERFLGTTSLKASAGKKYNFCFILFHFFFLSPISCFSPLRLGLSGL